MIHVTDDDLILHYYGEPTGDPRVEQHLASCAHCRDEFARLSQTLAIVEAHPVPDPATGFERNVWARLAPALETPRGNWFSALLAFAGLPPLKLRRTGKPRATQWTLAGAAAAIVLVAFLAGRFSQRVAPDGSTNGPVATATPNATERVLLVAVGDHLDRTQMVLVELMNADGAQAASLENEQSLARELVAANRLYRQTAAQAGEAAIGDVLEEVERVLLEIANAPPDVTARELESLRGRIEARGLLFRVRVVQSEMRERERKNISDQGVS